MKRKILYISIFASMFLCLTSCAKEEAPKETKAAENVNSLLDKYVKEEAGDETENVADNSGSDKIDTATPNDGTNEEPTASGQSNTSKNNQDTNNEEQTTSKSQNSNNGQGSNNGQSGNTSTTDKGNKENANKQTVNNPEIITTKPYSTTTGQNTPTTPIATTSKLTGSTTNPVESTTTSSSASSPTSGKLSGDVKWKLEGNTLTVYGQGAMPDSSASAYPWYDYRTDIQKVIISNGVTSIGSYAFGGCARNTGSTSVQVNYPSLTYVEVADTVTKVGDSAFYYTENLVEIKMSNNVTSIGDYAFYACTSLTTLNLPATMKSFGGPMCFDQCNKSVLKVYISSNCPANIKQQLSNWGINCIVQ